MRTETKKDGPRSVLGNGHLGNMSSISRFSSLLVSKDRDFLLSPTGSQVLYFSIYPANISDFFWQLSVLVLVILTCLFIFYAYNLTIISFLLFVLCRAREQKSSLELMNNNSWLLVYIKEKGKFWFCL